MKVTAFEGVKSQIGLCGIWCGSCVMGNGALVELTRRYEKIIKDYGLEGWSAKDFNFEEFANGLTSIQAVSSCPGCREGGGRDNCEMRACVSGKEINDCSECDEPYECKYHEILERMRSGALRAGLMVKTEKADRRTLLENWMTNLKEKWPSCILFSCCR